MNNAVGDAVGNAGTAGNPSTANAASPVAGHGHAHGHVRGQASLIKMAVGAVGVIGPTRMEYPKAITGVRFMSSVMSELVESVKS